MREYRIIQIDHALYVAQQGRWGFWRDIASGSSLKEAEQCIEFHDLLKKEREEKDKKYPVLVGRGYVDAYGKFQQYRDPR